MIPMNQIRVQEQEYPETKDAFPLLSRLRFDNQFLPAFMQIFGSTLVSRDLAIGAVLSRKYNLDAVTLDGDQVSRKGSLKGGYVDSSFSPLRSLRKLRV